MSYKKIKVGHLLKIGKFCKYTTAWYINVNITKKKK